MSIFFLIFPVSLRVHAVKSEIMPGLRLLVASLPDLAVSKLIWISKGSHKSRRDLRQLLMRATSDQPQTVHKLADSLVLRDLLDEVLAESDEIED
jgi:hypothetical protein